MFENPFKKQTPKPAQETTPQSSMEKIQDFFAGKLETMSPLFDKIQAQFDALGENAQNLKLSPELASRAKIALPVFMAVLATLGSVDQASAQVANSQGISTTQVVNNPGNQGAVQMTQEQLIAYQQQQKHMKNAKNLTTATQVLGTLAGGATMVGMTSQDPKVRQAALITGGVLGLASGGTAIGAMVEAGKAGGTVNGGQMQGQGGVYPPNYRPGR